MHPTENHGYIIIYILSQTISVKGSKDICISMVVCCLKTDPATDNETTKGQSSAFIYWVLLWCLAIISVLCCFARVAKGIARVVYALISHSAKNYTYMQKRISFRLITPHSHQCHLRISGMVRFTLMIIHLIIYERNDKETLINRFNVFCLEYILKISHSCETDLNQYQYIIETKHRYVLHHLINVIKVSCYIYFDFCDWYMWEPWRYKWYP